MNTGLELQDVSLSVGSRQLLSLSCTIAPGEVMTVMGASGTGKSTLLAFIAGFLGDAFTAEGKISLEGEALNPVPAEQRRIGLLFQDALLFPHLSVAENLKFGLVRTAGESRTDRDDRVEQALEEISLGGFGERDPASLSGGQQSRIALMRLLLSEPQAILLDEPFSNLDMQLRGEIRAFTFDSIRAANIPALLVTHDLADAQAAGGKILAL